MSDHSQNVPTVVLIFTVGILALVVTVAVLDWIDQRRDDRQEAARRAHESVERMRAARLDDEWDAIADVLAEPNRWPAPNADLIDLDERRPR